MSNKFDQFVGEVLNPKLQKDVASIPSESAIISKIRQDLTDCSSDLDNLAYQYKRDSQMALGLRRAMMKVDEARTILFTLQK